MHFLHSFKTPFFITFLPRKIFISLSLLFVCLFCFVFLSFAYLYYHDANKDVFIFLIFTNHRMIEWSYSSLLWRSKQCQCGFFGRFLAIWQAWRNAMVLDFQNFEDKGNGQLGENYKYYLVFELSHDTIWWSTMGQALSNYQGGFFTNHIEIMTFNGKKKNTK